MTEPLTIRYQPCDQSPQRVRFHKRSDGRFRREEQTWTGCVWRTRGTEIVEDLEVTPTPPASITEAGP